MKYISSILKEFSQKQRVFVLIIMLFFISITYITTTYLKSDHNSCQSVIELNQKYVNDFIRISDLIRQERLASLGLSVQDSCIRPTLKSRSNKVSIPQAEPMVEDDTKGKILDEILTMTESNIKKD